jgi:hypothetical protein
MSLQELTRLCAERELRVVEKTDPDSGENPAVVVRARSDNRKLAGFPDGLRIRASGAAYSIIEIADVGQHP